MATLIIAKNGSEVKMSRVGLAGTEVMMFLGSCVGLARSLERRQGITEAPLGRPKQLQLHTADKRRHRWVHHAAQRQVARVLKRRPFVVVKSVLTIAENLRK